MPNYQPTNAIAKKLRRSVVIEEHFGGFSQPWYLRSWLATLSRLRISFLAEIVTPGSTVPMVMPIVTRKLFINGSYMIWLTSPVTMAVNW